MNQALVWIDDALNQIDLKKAPEPQHKAKKENILGVMSDDLKKLLVLKTEKEGEANKLANEIRHLLVDVSQDEKKRTELDNKQILHSGLRDQIEAIHHLFWTQVHAEFAGKIPSKAKKLEYCAGWTICYSTESDEPICIEIISFGQFAG